MIRQIPVFLKSILLGSSIIIGLGIFFSATPALAISISTAIPGMSNVSSSTPPGAYIGAFYNFALMISGILALGAIVYGGVLYAMSAGNSSKQSEGRAWITSALTGLLLLGGAYLILYTINPNLVSLSLPQLQPVNISVSSTAGTAGCNITCPAGLAPMPVGTTGDCVCENATGDQGCGGAVMGTIPCPSGQQCVETQTNPITYSCQSSAQYTCGGTQFGKCPPHGDNPGACINTSYCGTGVKCPPSYECSYQ